MKGSFKELSIPEPLPYPTIEDLPTHLCILSLDEVNERLNTLTLDMYNMYLLAL